MEFGSSERSDVARTIHFPLLHHSSRLRTTKLSSVINRHAGRNTDRILLSVATLRLGVEHFISQSLDIGLPPVGLSHLGLA